MSNSEIYIIRALYLLLLGLCISGSQQHQFSILQQDNVQLKDRLTNLESEKESLYSNLTYLIKDNNELLLTVSAYNLTLRNQNQTIQFLSQILAEVNKRIEGWASFMTSTKQDAVAVRDDLIYINNEILTLENRTEKTYQLVTEQKFIVAALSNKLRVIREFTVQNTNYIGNLHQHQVVVFDQVTTNEGGRYNAQTGIFTADINGWYVFFFDIRVRHLDKLCLSELVKNNAAIVLTYGLSGVGLHEHKSESNMAVLHVQAGDQIWVRSSPVEEKSCAIDDHSSFSCFLLNAD